MRPRTTTVKPSRLSASVTQLRKAMGQTQQQFAQTLGTSITTVARYETSRTPSEPQVLLKLYQLALDQLALHTEDNDFRDELRNSKEVFYSALLAESTFFRGRFSNVLGIGLRNSLMELADILKQDLAGIPNLREGLLKIADRLAVMERGAQLLDPGYYKGVDPEWKDVARAFAKCDLPLPQCIADELVQGKKVRRGGKP